MHDRQAMKLSKCLKEAKIPESIIQVKATLFPKGSPTMTLPRNYRLITCLSIMWGKANLLAKRRNLLVTSMPRIIFGRKLPQGNKTSKWPTMNIRRHTHSHAKDWIQERLWYDSPNVDNRIFEIYRMPDKNHKPHLECMRNWRVELTLWADTLCIRTRT